ncbi:MAG: HepT-like ribonuclease domain-containing protein [Candidatus Njordarchaeum guaymaensis]
MNEKMAEELKRLNGLRNIIVHKYNKLDEKIVIESLDEILNIIFSFIEVVENAIQKIFK